MVEEAPKEILVVAVLEAAAEAFAAKTAIIIISRLLLLRAVAAEDNNNNINIPLFHALTPIQDAVVRFLFDMYSVTQRD